MSLNKGKCELICIMKYNVTNIGHTEEHPGNFRSLKTWFVQKVKIKHHVIFTSSS